MTAHTSLAISWAELEIWNGAERRRSTLSIPCLNLFEAGRCSARHRLAIGVYVQHRRARAFAIGKECWRIGPQGGAYGGAAAPSARTVERARAHFLGDNGEPALFFVWFLILGLRFSLFECSSSVNTDDQKKPRNKIREVR